MNEDLHKPRILVTEDDFENQMFLKIFLKRQFEIEICDSEESFYNFVMNSKFDLILMDISIKGGKDGLELTRELRNIPGYEKIPIVCLSAHTFKKDIENAYNAGIDIYLTKPVENKTLMNTLLKAVGRKSLPE